MNHPAPLLRPDRAPLRAIAGRDDTPIHFTHFGRYELLGLESIDGTHAGAATDSKTLELLLRARACYQTFDVELLSEAQAHIELALERSPEDPSVWASAALILARRWLLEPELEPEPEPEPEPELLSRARELSLAAVANAGELGEAHLALGSVQYFAGESIQAARSLRAALARSPSSPDAHELLGMLLLEAGLIDVGLQRLAIASRLNPALHLGRRELLRVLALRGQWSEVDDMLEVAAGLAPHPSELWIQRARFSGWRGCTDFTHRLRVELDSFTGRVSAAQATRLWFARTLLEVQTDQGSPAPLFEALDQLIAQRGASPHRTRFRLELLAEIAAWTGEHERALQAIEELCALELGGAMWLERCALLEGLRERPRIGCVRSSFELHQERLLDTVWLG